MSNIELFGAFQKQEIRWNGNPDKPEWVAQDVCSILGLIGDAGQHLRNFSQKQKGLITIQTPGGKQKMLTVTEPGLYRLIFKSRKKEAERFQEWVFEEVLTSIRKTGKYELPKYQLPILSPAPEITDDLWEIRSYLEGIQSLNKVIHTAIYQQSDLIKEALFLVNSPKKPLYKLKKQISLDKLTLKSKHRRKTSNHIAVFCQDIGLNYVDGSTVYAGELLQHLRSWYIEKGILQIVSEGNDSSLVKEIWRRELIGNEQVVKRLNQIFPPILQVFPLAQRERDSKGRHCLYGLGLVQTI